MSSEIKAYPTAQKWNIDTVVVKKFRCFDRNGSTSFSITSSTWSLRRRSTGAEILSGTATVNNADTDRAGNAIKSIGMSVDLRATDELTRGSYYFLVETLLNTQQSDVFRFPVEVVDYRRKDAY